MLFYYLICWRVKCLAKDASRGSNTKKQVQGSNCWAAVPSGPNACQENYDLSKQVSHCLFSGVQFNNCKIQYLENVAIRAICLCEL